MKKSTEFIKERAALIEAQKRLHEAAEKETRSLNETETLEFRKLQGEIEALSEKIKDAEAYENNLRMMAGAGAGESASKGEEREREEIKKGYSFHAAVRSQLPGGKLEGRELEIHQETLKRAKEANVAIEGVAIPTDFRGRQPEKRFGGQSVTLDAGEYGQALVAEDRREIIEFLRANPIVRSLGARVMTGLEGDLVFPVNEGGITATWEGEADEIDQSKNKYTKKGMKPKRLGTAVPITLQNLMQSSIDIERYTIDEINAAMNNALDLAAINGSGTGNVPKGVLQEAGANIIAIGTNGGVPTWSHLVNAKVKVGTANAGRLPNSKFGWAINPETLGKLETTQKVDGQAVFLLENGKINGYPFADSGLVPNNLTKGTGTNLSAAIFGDWNQLLIGQWGWIDVTVDNISKKKEGYIEIVVNQFADVMVRQPKAFTIIKDWVTV